MSDFAQDLAQQIPRLRRYARALTRNAAWADDLVQDTLERALGRRWLFRLNSNLTAWLYTMLYRLYLNDAARAQRRMAVPEEQAPEPAASGDMALRLDLRRALERLSAEHRAVLILVALEELSYQETAAVLGIPLGTVMSRLARAREQLRRRFDDDATTPAAPASGASLTRVK
ncbi:MAG TPA: sigma-70 family RNA polymerase sigma factor [Burkholderiaceae bacterium]|nr:sigma-70 family RNA polymerase sigma factor [Burkholderiaceae bacterium]